MRILTITIEAFRGFVDQVTFDIQNSEVILLYGPNGHGKTSMFDAIEWALTGEIHRFSTSTDERKRTRFIRNLHAKENQTTFVTLDILVDSNTRAKVKRVCTAEPNDNTDYGKHKLEITLLHSGEEKEELITASEAESLLRSWLVHETWTDKVSSPSRIISLTHILGQEKLNEFVQGMKDGERYSSLSILFGTEHFSKYKDLFKETLNDLKNQSKFKVGEISGVEASIKNIQRDSKELETRTASRKKEPLKKVLLPYVNHFNNIKDLYDKEDWTEFSNLVYKNQEHLRSERFRLENSVQHLKNIKNSLPEWKSNKEFLKNVPEEIKKLNKWLDYTQQLRIIQSLLEQFSQFQEGLITEKNLVEKIQHTNHTIQGLLKRADIIDDFVRNTRSILEKELETKTFNDLSSLTDSEFGNKKVVTDLINYFSSMKDSHNSILTLNKGYESNRVILNDLEKAVHKLQGIDKSFQDMLNSLNTYLTVKNNIEECPACGTTGISIDDLRYRIIEKQGEMNTELPGLEIQIKEIKENIKEQSKEIKNFEGKFKASYEAIVKLLENLEKKAKDTRDSATRGQHYERQQRKELEELRNFIYTYNQEANKLGLDISIANFGDNLKLKELELKSLLSPLSLEYRANLSEKVQSLERKIPQAREVINHFIGNLEALDDKTKDTHSWNETDIEAFLDRVSDEQSRSLNSLEEKEEVTFKTLSSLDQALDEFQLLSYQQNLKKQIRHLEILNKERERIDKDCEALEEALSKVKTAMDSLNNRMIEELFDTVQKIFTHINSHPLYNKLEFSKEHRNKAYRLLIHVLTGKNESEIPANASYIFSSAQVNSIALSFFIAMALHQKWSPLQLVGIDDPIQSMDEVNILAFIDLLRLFIEKYNKQIIISTHNYTFYSMVLKKLRFQNIAVIEYEGYSERGPSIKEQEDEHHRFQLVQHHPQLRVEELTSEIYKLDHEL